MRAAQQSNDGARVQQLECAGGTWTPTVKRPGLGDAVDAVTGIVKHKRELKASLTGYGRDLEMLRKEGGGWVCRCTHACR